MHLLQFNFFLPQFGSTFGPHTNKFSGRFYSMWLSLRNKVVTVMPLLQAVLSYVLQGNQFHFLHVNLDARGVKKKKKNVWRQKHEFRERSTKDRKKSWKHLSREVGTNVTKLKDSKYQLNKLAEWNLKVQH